MNSSSVRPILPREKLKEIEKASQSVTRCIEKIRSNLAPIFLAEEQKRKLHTRYLQQKKKRIWDALEMIAEILKKYNSQPNLKLLLIEGILKTITITRGDINNILGCSGVGSKARELMSDQDLHREKGDITLILEIIRESGISIDGLERFLTVISRKIGNN